jgi:hypothetical protein
MVHSSRDRKPHILIYLSLLARTRIISYLRQAILHGSLLLKEGVYQEVIGECKEKPTVSLSIHDEIFWLRFYAKGDLGGKYKHIAFRGITDRGISSRGIIY